jgi:glycosyltransferase involved in cell wall biosynthesis
MDYYSQEIQQKLIEICSDSRFKLISNKNRSGIHKNRATGVLNSSGDYVFFIDSDDWISDDYLTELVSELELQKADIIKGPQMLVDCRTGEMTYNGDEPDYYTTAGKQTIWKRECLNEYCSYDLFLQYAEDNLESELASKFKYIFVEKGKYFYTQYNTDQLTNIFLKSGFEIKLRLIGTYNTYVLSYNIKHNQQVLDRLKKELLEVWSPRVLNNCKNIDQVGQILNFVQNTDIKTWQNNIPKIIHYVYISDVINDDAKRCIESWKKTNPDYLILKWDDSFFKNNKFVQEAVKTKKFAFAADYIRLWVLYNFGGIYLDSDCMLYQSFDKYLNEKIIFSFEDDDIMISMVCIGTPFHNKYIKKILDWFDSINFSDLYTDNSEYIIETKFGKISWGRGYNLTKVGSKILMPHVLSGDIKVYPNEYFCGGHYTEKGKQHYKVTENTVCEHLFAGSWLKEPPKDYLLGDFGFK